MTWRPVDVVAVITMAVVMLCFGLIICHQAQFMATATEKCEQVIDFDDNKTIIVRDGNYINNRITYHGYDVCRSTKDGNITSRKDLGYGTELQIKLHGV
jgi:uncharacterized protein with FMN-binding domain